MAGTQLIYVVLYILLCVLVEGYGRILGVMVGIFRGCECFFGGGNGGLDKPAAGTLRECWAFLNLRVYAASFDFAGVCRLWSDGLRCLQVYSFYPKSVIRE